MEATQGGLNNSPTNQSEIETIAKLRQQDLQPVLKLFKWNEG